LNATWLLVGWSEYLRNYRFTVIFTLNLLVYRECCKKRKNPVRGTSVGENALLIVRGQRRKSNHYNRGLPKSISECTTCQTLKQICY